MAMSAIEQLRKPKSIKIVKTLPDGVKNWGPPGASMVVSTPQEVDLLLKQVPAANSPRLMMCALSRAAARYDHRLPGLDGDLHRNRSPCGGGNARDGCG